jgi:hypothetical protein
VLNIEQSVPINKDKNKWILDTVNNNGALRKVFTNGDLVFL